MKTRIFSTVGLFLLCFQLAAFAKPVKEVNEKLVKSFQAAFPDASQVNWREQQDHYFVRFTQASVISEIEYDQQGDFVNSIRYYKDASLLPLNISWKLHKKFADKIIFAFLSPKKCKSNCFHFSVLHYFKKRLQRYVACKYQPTYLQLSSHKKL